MKLEVHQRLSELSTAAGKEYGKLVQKLLAIALLEAGAESLTDRSTQGIDLEATFRGKKRAIEVKTTESGAVSLGKKDLEGLAAREADGMRAYVAAHYRPHAVALADANGAPRVTRIGPGADADALLADPSRWATVFVRSDGG